MSVFIDNFKGSQVSITGDQAAYIKASKVYATSSHGVDHDMKPALVISPATDKNDPPNTPSKADQDIVTAIVHAKEKKRAISIKSGGHQYSGACSTSGNNIMMDLSDSFTHPTKDLAVLPEVNGKTYVYASVSHSLGELNAFLTKNGLFIPHGQCAYVHVGGHGQTGGYGQLGRAFGLFGDHIRSIRIFLDSAQKVEDVKDVTKENDPELFYAILGGSPGNFGIITHYTLEVHRDADVVFGDVRPYAMRATFLYTPDVLNKMLTMVAEMGDDPSFAHNYDLCVSVLSKYSKTAALGNRPLLTHDDIVAHPDVPNDTNPKKPNVPLVVVYAQFIPFSANDKVNTQWFNDIKTAAPVVLAMDIMDKEPMSQITGMWIFREPREFAQPYHKRTYMTSSNTLKQDNWAQLATERIDMIVNPAHDDPNNELYQHTYLAVQIQPFGGKDSGFFANRNNGTSWSWRDSTVCQVLDLFYDEGHSDVGLKWAKENDALMNGPNSKYSKQDKRVLWGSYGDYCLDNDWPFYYENKAKYERIGKTRARVDPDGTFTANPFNVKRVMGTTNGTTNGATNGTH